MPDKRRIYWDACVFLAYINGDGDRIGILDPLLDEARDGEIELLTSMVSEVEVAYGRVEQEQGTADQDVLDQINDFWLPGSPVELVEFHRLIAETARDFVRDARLVRGERLTPLDAVHVATAAHMEAVEFHTYDGKLLAQGERFGFPITEPQTARPRIPGVG